MESYVISHVRCPECERVGNDKSGDNLAVYSDGHKYCFRCSYYIRNSGLSISNPVKLVSKVNLPPDCDTNYPDYMLDWVSQVGLTKGNLLKHGVLYSKKGIKFNRKGQLNVAENVLIFPIYANGLVGYQARTFDGKSPKWLSKGDNINIFHILKGRSDSKLTLVEDIVSAIKVNMAGFSSMSVFGNTLKNRFERLKRLGYDDLNIWLDPDMKVHVIKQCKYAVGISTRIIFSDSDPKEYSLAQIKRFLL